MILVAVAVEAELGSWRAPAGVETLVTGIGPVEASCAVAAALAGRTHRLVVNAGIAGVLGGAAEVGTGVVVSEDVMELALENGSPLTLPEGISLTDTAHSDPHLVAQLRERGFPALRGITVSSVTATQSTALRLARERGAQVESMEGFAVLRAAQRAGIRAVELRGISNRCGAREAGGWDFAAGAAGLRRILEVFFELATPSGDERT